MTISFWNNNHPLQSLYNELYDSLVPSHGSAETLAGEVIRAATKLYYDYYNNGLCNNVTGAVDFLNKHIDIIDYDYVWSVVTINEFFDGNKFEDVLEKIVENAVEFASKEENQIPNNDNLFNYGLTENEFYELREEDEEDDEDDYYDDGGWFDDEE